jgi:hypothetical protein
VVSAYQVQLLLHRVLEHLGIKLPRMIFRASLDPNNGEPFLKVDLGDGERLATALEGLALPSETDSATRTGQSEDGSGAGA